MNPVDVLLTVILVVTITIASMLAVGLCLIALKNKRVASSGELFAALIVSHSLISGKHQLILFAITLVMAAVIDANDMPLTAIATVFCGIANMAIYTLFWWTASRMSQYTYPSHTD